MSQQAMEQYVATQLANRSLEFRVPLSKHFAGSIAHNAKPFWKLLSKLETDFWSDELEEIRIDRPVYISGLARSGTTILLENLFATDQFASFKYKHYPFIDTPLLWELWLNLWNKESLNASERSHLDGISVTTESPEAFEEMYWMDFFPTTHKENASAVLTFDTKNGEFEAYYPNQIKKILLAEKKSRYLAKGNYNITRLNYILKIFPHARFIIPIREPETHIASLIKQDLLFTAVTKNNKKALDYLERSGHFEFGVGRSLINTGNTEIIKSIKESWQTGNVVQGWAQYWNMIHEHIYEQLDANPKLKAATHIVSYEKLCGNSDEELRKIFAHLSISVDIELQKRLSRVFRLPSYYQARFSKDEKKAIKEVTSEIFKKLLVYT